MTKIGPGETAFVPVKIEGHFKRGVTGDQVADAIFSAGEPPWPLRDDVNDPPHQQWAKAYGWSFISAFPPKSDVPHFGGVWGDWIVLEDTRRLFGAIAPLMEDGSIVILELSTQNSGDVMSAWDWHYYWGFEFMNGKVRFAKAEQVTEYWLAEA